MAGNPLTEKLQIPSSKSALENSLSSEFFGGREGQAAFAVEEFLQAFVFGTALTADNARRHAFA